MAMEATSEATSEEGLQPPEEVYGEYVMHHWEPDVPMGEGIWEAAGLLAGCLDGAASCAGF